MKIKALIRDLLYKLGLFKPIKKFLLLYYNPMAKKRALKYVKEILCKVRPVLEKNSSEYWIDYGTLLGYTRLRKLLPGDDDLDFAILKNNGESISGDMQKAGFILKKQLKVEGKVTFEQYRYRGFGFDLFYYREENDKYITNIWLPEHYNMPQKIAYKEGKCTLSETTFKKFETKEVEFYNCKFRAPKDEGEYLAQHYGEDYMTPNPNFSLDDELNRKIVSKEYELKFTD